MDHLTHAEERLVNEFSGIFSPETVAECLRDSADKLTDAPVQTYVGSAVHLIMGAPIERGRDRWLFLRTTPSAMAPSLGPAADVEEA